MRERVEAEHAGHPRVAEPRQEAPRARGLVVRGPQLAGARHEGREVGRLRHLDPVDDVRVGPEDLPVQVHPGQGEDAAHRGRGTPETPGCGRARRRTRAPRRGLPDGGRPSRGGPRRTRGGPGGSVRPVPGEIGHEQGAQRAPPPARGAGAPGERRVRPRRPRLRAAPPRRRPRPRRAPPAARRTGRLPSRPRGRAAPADESGQGQGERGRPGHERHQAGPRLRAPATAGPRRTPAATAVARTGRSSALLGKRKALPSGSC